MARIRNVKPEFFRSETVAELTFRQRLLWIGLWTECDNYGRARDNPRLIKGAVWPLDDVSLKEIEDDLATLAAHQRIVRYQVDGKRYLVVTNWSEHQYGAFKGEPKYPAPPDGPNKSGPDPHESRNGLEKSGGIQGSRVRGQGGGTREGAHPPPGSPPRCQRHAHLPEHDPGPNCMACRDVRLAAERTANQPTPKPPWCGKCDPETRQLDRDGRVGRCKDCHPLRSVS